MNSLSITYSRPHSYTPCGSVWLQIADKIGLPGLYLHEMIESDIEGTGTLIWSAGIRLSQHLVKNRAGELKNAKVLDIGSGTGGLTSSCVLTARHRWDGPGTGCVASRKLYAVSGTACP